MIIMKTDVMGIPISTINKKELGSALHELIMTYKYSQNAKYIATLNMESLSNCFNTLTLKTNNNKLYKTLKHADLVIADGMPIVCFGKLSNPMMMEKISHLDMIDDIAKYAALLGHKIYYIGENIKLCKEAHRSFKKKHPRLKAAGFANPKIGSNGEILDDPDLIHKINDSFAGFLLIGLESSKAALFFNHYKEQLMVPISMGVGDSYKYISGKLDRAPESIQNSGFEWLHRLTREPGKLWRPYLKQILFLISLIMHGRLKLINYISYHHLNLIDHWDNFSSSAQIVGHLNQKMVGKIHDLIDQCSLTKVNLENLTDAERGCMPRLQRLCRVNNIELGGLEQKFTPKDKTRIFKKYTKSLITRVM